MRFLERLYRTKYFEEMLGITGIGYVVIVVAVAGGVIWFLVNVMNAAFVKPPIPPSTIAQFNIDKAQAFISTLP